MISVTIYSDNGNGWLDYKKVLGSERLELHRRERYIR